MGKKKTAAPKATSRSTKKKKGERQGLLPGTVSEGDAKLIQLGDEFNKAQAKRVRATNAETAAHTAVMEEMEKQKRKVFHSKEAGGQFVLDVKDPTKKVKFIPDSKAAKGKADE